MSNFSNPMWQCRLQILHFYMLLCSFLHVCEFSVKHLIDHSQHSMGREATCRARTRLGGATGGAKGRWVRKTKRTRVFFLPTSVSPFLSSMSEFLSFRIPAQSMLQHLFNHKCVQGSHVLSATEMLSWLWLGWEFSTFLTCISVSSECCFFTFFNIIFLIGPIKVYCRLQPTIPVQYKAELHTQIKCFCFCRGKVSSTHSAVMLFSGLRGMSSSLVPAWTLS